MSWKEYQDPETGVRCWRMYFSARVRGHVTADCSWAVSRRGELPIEWGRAESLELAMRAAEDYADRVPDIGPIPLSEPGI